MYSSKISIISVPLCEMVWLLCHEEIKVKVSHEQGERYSCEKAYRMYNGPQLYVLFQWLKFSLQDENIVICVMFQVSIKKSKS